ncbi:MAG: NAD-dependent epimerase/dehydratase family protein [Nitrospiraceae bacterium]|nr:MAG: NAD-dependent epimerase/dehydratase family protein [Nitrospiraceae bacterium]
MKILVTGATGFTGRRVLPLLRGKGDIRCFARVTSDLKKIVDLDYEVAYGDFTDSDSLRRAMTGCDALVNIASLGFGHAAGIVKVAEESGIKRAVFISTTALFTKLNANSKSVRRQAEDYIRASGLNWTILRPTMIYGAPDDRNMIRFIGFIDRSPLVPIFGSGEYLQQPVHVEDVAKAVVAVLFNDDAIKKEFNISGKYPHSYNEMIDLAAKALGKRVLKVHIPFRPSLLAFKFYEKLAARPLVKSEQIMRLNEDKDFDHSAAGNVFGFDPVSFEEGIIKEVAMYRERQSNGLSW